MYIDSHAHVDAQEFDRDRGEALERARLAQVERILVVASGFSREAIETVVRLVEDNPFLDLCVGIHPHEAATATNLHLDMMKEIATHPRVVGWGEIGLDFHYNHSPREVQKDIFIRQLVLAEASDLPVIVHSREAEAETIEILKNYARGGRGAVLHCFTASLEMAERCVEMGFLVSFSGILTFPRSQDLRKIAQMIPLEKVLVETDCPYLAPLPYRGKRNEPAYVVETARTLAEVRGLAATEVARVTTENYRRFFQIA
jgi:TatD DNase family protein